jgi:hypothetical protein
VDWQIAAAGTQNTTNNFFLFIAVEVNWTLISFCARVFGFEHHIIFCVVARLRLFPVGDK